MDADEQKQITAVIKKLKKAKALVLDFDQESVLDECISTLKGLTTNAQTRK